MILNVTNIDFPVKPAVSADCRDFIVKCLQKDVQRRWNVVELCDHPFINPTKSKYSVCFESMMEAGIQCNEKNECF